MKVPFKAVCWLDSTGHRMKAPRLVQDWLCDWLDWRAGLYDDSDLLP